MSAPPPRPPRRRWSTLASVDDVLWKVVERDQRDSDAAFRRRRLVSMLTVVLGAAGLAASLQMDRDNPWFPAAALGVAAVWAGGAFLAGRLHLGRIMVGEDLVRPIVQPILIGLAMALVFIAGAFLISLIPPLADQVRSVLAFAESGSLLLLTITTLLSGIAEELFFRGSMYAAVRAPHQVAFTTVAYTIATILTGNVMLGFAAVIMGIVTGLQRRATGGVLAPILTHITWSMAMLHVLPLVL